MILQIQSDEPVVTIKESEYFKLKYAKDAFDSQQLEDQKFIAALIKEFAVLKGVTVTPDHMEAGQSFTGEYKIPGYHIEIKIRKGQQLKYMYQKIQE